MPITTTAISMTVRPAIIASRLILRYLKAKYSAMPMMGNLITYTNIARTVSSGFWFSFFLKTMPMVHQMLVNEVMLTTDPMSRPVVTGRSSNKRDTAMSIIAITTDKKKYLWGNPSLYQPAFFDLLLKRLTVLKNSMKAPITLSNRQISKNHGAVPNLLSR